MVAGPEPHAPSVPPFDPEESRDVPVLSAHPPLLLVLPRLQAFLAPTRLTHGPPSPPSSCAGYPKGPGTCHPPIVLDLLGTWFKKFLAKTTLRFRPERPETDARIARERESKSHGQGQHATRQAA
ncbi:hypothetical protein RRG08_052979 [Elysia crispata]|uniref:Uncharacterized protein n=1 Tax=Elysia crispata TaxID=231223 RepID=A0AAE1DH98_9GAST|nr:hypothetical protein RRG08_052979 [Elysia crispata]